MTDSLAGQATSSMRRELDIFVALLGLILLAPVMLLIALLIRLGGGPGPVFYVQQRLGQGGKLFWIYKFRKFYHCTAKTGYSITLRRDPRMTPIGQILERTKLDELPQLWNILRGDMSIVGPRPETLEFANCFTDRYRSLLEHRPGLFGPSQAIFRNESTLYPNNCHPHEFYRTVLFPAKMDIDLTYYHNRTLVLDLLWIVRGIGAVLGVQSYVLGMSLRSDGATLSHRLLNSASGEPNPIIREPLT